MSEQSFTAMAGLQAAPDAPEIGVGMLGYAFMGKAHSNAFKKIPYMMYPPVAIPALVAICGRNVQAVAAAAKRYGYQKQYTDWRDMLADDQVQLFDNGGSNDVHVEPCIVAAQAGKHILCEKPLGRTAEEAKLMWDTAVQAGIKHMTAFNYRFVPAVRQARYFIGLAHYLVGEIKSLSAMTKTFVTERPLSDGGSFKVAGHAGKNNLPPATCNLPHSYKNVSLCPLSV